MRHIIVYHDLPVQSAEGPRAQSHHPPLYYVLGAVASCWVPVEQDVYYDPLTNPHWDNRYWEVSVDNKNQYLHGADERFPFHGVTLAVHVVRWMTILIGLGIVVLTYSIGCEIFAQPIPAAIGAAMVAFIPQFVYLRPRTRRSWANNARCSSEKRQGIDEQFSPKIASHVASLITRG